MNILKNQKGEVSRILVLIAVAAFLIIIVVYGVTTFISYQKTQKKTAPTQSQTQSSGPMYDADVGNVRFLFESAEDMGNTLKALHTYSTDLTTTERFIKLTVGAQNLGDTNTQGYSWDIGDIIDSAGRHFTDINNKAYDWLPRPDLCGSILKPQFAPVPCVKYYEVSRISTSLKVQVKVSDPIKGQKTIDILVH